MLFRRTLKFELPAAAAAAAAAAGKPLRHLHSSKTNHLFTPQTEMMILLHPHHRSLHTLFFSSSFSSSSSIFMGLLKCCSPCAAVTISSSSSSFLYHHLLHTHHRPQLFFFFSPLLSSSKPISKFFPPTSSRGLCSSSTALSRVPLTTVQVEDRTDDEIDRALLAVLKQKLEQLGIRCATVRPAENTHVMCPKCEGGSTMERSLALLISADCKTALWTCHRATCGWKGRERAVEGVSASFGTGYHIAKATTPCRKITEQSIGLEPLCEELLEYFMERMITGETLRRNAVMQKSSDEVLIAFTYKRNGVLVNCKYRSIDKVFRQEKNTEKILYGLDDIKQVSDIIIVEGEMDKLSMEEAGFRNCVSVPNGAPSKVSNKDLPPKLEDTSYQYLWNCKEYFDKVSRVILATDADQPGQALADELARRLGKERCWRVKWPMKNEVDVCKDANEVLMCLGPHALREVIDQAELYPIRGLFNYSVFYDDIKAYYYGSMGYERGVSTGWTCLDDLYNVVPGELTLVTGVPNSGKSEWIDALLCNINENEGWKFALCSMENTVIEHARKLLEKHIKKPFFGAKYAGSVQRMDFEDDIEVQGIKWLNDTFYQIRCEDDCLPSVKWVLDLAKAAVLRHGIRGLVIDPYNELDHQRPSNQTETEYVSQILTQIKRFAQHYSCHVWFVAHPRQLQNWTGGAPNLYDISGSAHFINKCDNGIVIHRNRDPAAGPIDQVTICVRKVRNKVAGKIGDALLSYCRVTGEYKDIKNQINGSR